ncbi:ATP-binding protein [Gemmatimonadota bacterium]
MPAEALPTMFAPAERAPTDTVTEQARRVTAETTLSEILNAIPIIVAVLNIQRQVVFANSALLRFLGEHDASRFLGMRWGEMLHCIHAFETEGGCGTTESCATCGAVNAMLNSLEGIEDVQECLISRKPAGNALDLMVTATPFMLDDERLTVLAAEDISHQKRRSALERTFFHDILNTAGGIQGLTALFDIAEPDEFDELKEMLARQSEQLIEEINTQRELLRAEQNQLTLQIATVGTGALLDSLAHLYSNHEVTAGKHIQIDVDSVDLAVQTDRTLVSRVVGNMLKNALEASAIGDTVTLGVQQIGDDISFWVHNPACMPREVQLQIFQRSFSTKGSGRGIGTYSIKLLGEQYLQGAVSFSSSEGSGTRFELKVPQIYDPSAVT